MGYADLTTNGEEMPRFYRDVLGFEHEGDVSMEHVGIKVMQIACGSDQPHQAGYSRGAARGQPAPGGIPTSTGYRYWTMTINNLDEALAAMAAAGGAVVWPRREVRQGVFIGMIEDPEGNWVEFIQAA